MLMSAAAAACFRPVSVRARPALWWGWKRSSVCGPACCSPIDTVVVSNDSFIRTDGEPNHLLTEPIAVETIGDIVAALAGRGITRVVPLGATRLAFEVVGSRAGTNMVLLGAAFASGRLKLEQAALEEVIIDLAPRDTGERNRQGFLAGIAAYRAAIREERW